jgi:hypothetical protein
MHIVSSQSRELPAKTPERLPKAERAGFSPEFELLRACCHPDPDLLAAALRQELRRERVFELADYHRVSPLLCTRLQDRVDVPASIQSALQARLATHCRRTIRFSAELVTILNALEVEGIPVIAQKGPALAQLLYSDPAMREFGDLDLFVQPAEVRRAATALGKLGYEQALQLTPRQERAYLQSGYEYVFGRGPDHHLLEVQWNVLPRFYSIDFDTDALFARAKDFAFEGRACRMLCMEDQILFLCVHAAKHQWAQLGMVRDIATLSRLELNWESTFETARGLGLLQIVAFSLLLANELLGSPVPSELKRYFDIKRCEELLVPVEGRMANAQEIPPESAAYFRFMLKLRERRKHRVSLLWRLATTPSVEEWKAVSIPEAFFPLYRGVRFARLLRRALH